MNLVRITASKWAGVGGVDDRGVEDTVNEDISDDILIYDRCIYRESNNQTLNWRIL
jgi:hypothetical protein